MPVYCIQAGKRGPLKIGVATDVRRRRAMLQTGHHQRLHLRGVTEGDRDREAEIHRAFAHLRLKGEWFKASAEILALFTKAPTPRSWHTGRQIRGSNHPLAAFMDRNEIKLGELAERAGTSAASLSRIIHGKQAPSLRLVFRLSEATGHAVGVNEIADAALTACGA